MSRGRARGRRSARTTRGRETPGPSGFLVIDKPGGLTSHDVVDRARGWLGTRRIGHLGTLDPQATGVLPLAVRDATKVIPFVPTGPKVYRGAIRLGVATDTYDGDGEVVKRHAGPLPEAGQVREAVASFCGEGEQIPPMYSSIKRAGVPLYRLARRGQSVERAPRKIHIASFEMIRYEAPDVEVKIECSAGTYVRSVASDLGERLGCGAHLKALARLRSGPFLLEQARRPEDIEAELARNATSLTLLRPVSALGLAILELRPEDVRRVRNGGALPLGGPRRQAGERLAALDPSGELIAILEVSADFRLHPLRVLAPPGARA